jgi:hypothetical protein
MRGADHEQHARGAKRQKALAGVDDADPDRTTGIVARPRLPQGREVN